MSYRIDYSRAAAKAFRKIHPTHAQRLLEAIELLADDPHPDGSIVLSGGDGEMRIRVGDYRVIYDVDDGRLQILVLQVGHRREVYR